MTLHVTGDGDSSPQAAPRPLVSPVWPQGYGQMNLGVAYETTRGEVLQELGPPTSRTGNCWLYRGRMGSIRGRNPGPYVDAMKFCFSAGPTGSDVMTRIVSHSPVHTIVRRDPVTHAIRRRTFPASWDAPITIARVPPWYLRQNS